MLVRIFICLLVSQKVFTQEVQSEKPVFDFIFQNYAKELRPVKDIRTAISVFVSPIIQNVVMINEKDEALTYIQWFSLLWKDEILHWEPANFSKVESIKVPANMIWIPDVFIIESQQMELIRKLERTIAWITFDGNVTAEFQEIVTIRCLYQIDDFPFDKQQCHISFGSWSYFLSEMELLPKDDFSFLLTLQNLKNNVEWNFTSFEVNATYKDILLNGQMISFPHLTYLLKFNRKPNYYLWTIVLPSFLITTLALIGIFTPNNCKGERQEKATLGLTTLLTMAVMLTLVTEEMPRSDNNLPLLGRYILYEICITSLGTFVSVLILVCHEKTFIKAWKLPQFMMKNYKKPHRLQRDEQLHDFWGATSQFAMSEEMRNSVERLVGIQGRVRDRSLENAKLTKLFDSIDTIILIGFLAANSILTIIIFYPRLL